MPDTIIMTVLRIIEYDVATGTLLNKEEITFTEYNFPETVHFSLLGNADKFPVFIALKSGGYSFFAETKVTYEDSSADGNLFITDSEAIHVLSVYHELNRSHFVYSGLHAQMTPPGRWPCLTVEVPDRTKPVTELRKAA